MILLFKNKKLMSVRCLKREYFSLLHNLCELQSLCGGRLKFNWAICSDDWRFWFSILSRWIKYSHSCFFRCTKPEPTLACMPFHASEWSCSIFSSYGIHLLVFILASGLNCESNNCSLCLCVRLCWERGALWGTLGFQVTRLDNDFALLLPVAMFLLSF